MESFKSFMLRAVPKIAGTHTPLPNVLTSQDQLLLLALFCLRLQWRAEMLTALLCKGAALPSSPEVTQLSSPNVAQVISLWAPISHPTFLSPNNPVAFTKHSDPVQGLVYMFLFLCEIINTK